MPAAVRVWEETVLIPTYVTGPPDKNPLFLEKRVYQGSSGVVYPYPVIDQVADEPLERPYRAVFLENRYLKIMLLPELGGRVQMALDKTNGYHFIYYNRVIKPALVGLAGPWISGGIEFNWPQHHRPSTFMPVEWRLVENDDGSCTVWCGEIERMFFTKGLHGFTLYPDRAYLEVRVQLYNRTSLPQSFLWWANPAVHVNDQYQSVFPPDVHAVMDHGRRDVSDFPIATGTYYKVDFSPGTDISRYANIPVPMSYMADHSDYDFLGDYDHGRQAGMLHVANHHLVPGKKQWTWGNGDFGQAWDRQLTDADGPYIELMCGAFTDNQPDFSWLMPGEEKRFAQVFMPYKAIGPAKNASREAAVNLDWAPGRAKVGVYLTEMKKVRVGLWRREAIVWQTEATLSPERALLEEVTLAPEVQASELTLRVMEADSGRTLLDYTPAPPSDGPTPAPAPAARPPREIETSEELFLNGLHLEQYRHATYAPEPYYEEALRRDPHDSRCLNALGRRMFQRGQFAEAEPYFRRAIAGLTRRNPNPYDGEAYYNLGEALRLQGRYDEAWDAFYKAAWNAAWQDAAFFELARLAARRNRLAEALELADEALRRNNAHHQARHLRTALLRRVGQPEAARHEADRALALDGLHYSAWWERRLLAGDDTFARLARGNTHLYLEVALDYGLAGLWEEAGTVLRAGPLNDPLSLYFLARFQSEQGDADGAAESYRQAAALPPDYCFPHRLECVPVLEGALRANPHDARAAYYLGNFWYAHRVHAKAIACWEQSRAMEPGFATVHRNLGLAYYNRLHDADRAQAAYQQAFALNPSDARVLFELDQLEKRLNRAPEARLAWLENQRTLVDRRDDLTLEVVTLLNSLGRHQAAQARLMGRRFHPWEGGEGKATGQYVCSLVEQAKALLAGGQPAPAIELLEQSRIYPPNLGEGKLPTALENNVHYYLGVAQAALGRTDHAQAHYEQAATGLSEPASALYYNDQPPEMLYYQGLARRALGQTEAANLIFQKAVDYGRDHLDDEITLDYFAVSLPTFLVFEEDLNHRNRVHCHYMLALGQLGLGNPAAHEHLTAVLALQADHQGALLQRRTLAERASLLEDREAHA